MRPIAVITLIALVVFTLTTATASGLALGLAGNPRTGAYESTSCDLSEIEVKADYYIVAPKVGYYTGFRIKGTGTKADCEGWTVYARVTHGNHFYYLKTAASDVSAEWTVLGVFEAEPGDPPVYATAAFDPNHVVANDPSTEKSVFAETRILISNVFPAEF
ncbi:MAG: hypothetical protein QG597_3699 [Actinomycetota bacterium]|nr:hypothetical protein [Actinomycetota bacterium]